LRNYYIQVTKNWFFEKKNNIDQPLAKLTKRERKLKLVKLEMKRGILQQLPLKSKGLISRICKELKNLNINKIIQSINGQLY
jgi:hypothetical protein